MSGNNPPRIMIIDDSPEDIHLLLTELKDNYQVNAATSADDALQILGDNQNTPDLILLDVNMPGTDGYQACKIIKEDPLLQDIVVVFLSANDSTEEIIQGLDAGAVDYIIKPYQPEILQSKIKSALQTANARQQLKRQADAANELAFTMMAESSSLGSIINFYRSSFTVNNAQELASSTAEAIATQNLSCIVYFCEGGIKEVESSSGTPSMLEIELLERLVNNNEPFIEKDERCFAIQQNIVALIKNMPLENAKRGSLKDFLKITLEGANAKLSYFAERQALSAEKNQLIGSVIQETKAALDELREKQENHKKENLEILDRMVHKVEHSFVSMGMSDVQEDNLLELISESINEALDHMEEGLTMDENIKNLVVKLSEAAKNAAS
ncbi:MAG: DNA-binding response OmpR family regulator [Flavobacteriales bacterium]